MNKINLISKKLKQRFLSINNLLESYFSKLNFLKHILKKTIFLLIIEFFLVYQQYLF